MVAPIFDHKGVPSGVLNATLYGRDALAAPGNLLLSAVCDAAQEIESEYFHHVYAHARIMSLGGRRGSALLAVDRDEIVLGASRAARLQLGLDERLISDGCCIADLFEEGDDNLHVAERGVLRRALARERGNITAAARLLHVSLATMKRKIRQHGLRRKS